MKYMLLIYNDPSLFEGDRSRELRSEMIAKHTRLQEDLRAAGVAYSGHQLQPATVATTVRAGGGAQTLHDGPFAETKEQLGGYYLIDAPDLDAAIAWARRIPTAEKGAVEVRPVVER
jgi:hypothetical protein